MTPGRRPWAFYPLAALFGGFVLFLYGPLATIALLSFQGPQGGLTFPMNGVSTHWFGKLWEGVGVVDIWGAFGRSLKLGFAVMLLTVCMSLTTVLAFRKGFRGSGIIYLALIASLIIPSIIVGLGIGIEFRLLDTAIKEIGRILGAVSMPEAHTTLMGLYTSCLGAHLTWTLPFGVLILFAAFNRLDPMYEEVARDLGATGWQSFRHVLLPLLVPGLIGVALFGFTLSFDEIGRTAQAAGDLNTLPLELKGLTTTVTTPEIYALGALTTAISLVAVLTSAIGVLCFRRSTGYRHSAPKRSTKDDR
jgi:putative spermidine/putrescine transport system permease protein